MGLFGQSSPFDADIEKATSEKNTKEDWTLILDVCDKVTANPRNAKECLKAIMRRMAHPDPHVVIQAITLLDACCNNCGKPFHLEVASREFENEYRRLLSKAQPPVSLKMCQLIKTWAENDFKTDPQLVLIPSLYQRLKSEGHEFMDAPSKAAVPTSTIAALKDPNVVSSQQEEEDIAKAIELSLKEVKNSPKKQTTTTATYPSLYPSFSTTPGSLGSITSSTSATPQPEPRKVRALYDFEAAEENELTFVAGEIIHVIDDSDPNWWKGYNQRGDGLFPSNFVTADLSVEPERLEINQKSKKTVQFEDETNTKNEDQKTEEQSNYVAEIDENKIYRLLHLLHEANPEDSSQDTEEMLRLEQEVHQMGPLIDAELERVDRKHAQLTQLSSDLVDAINLYHTLMRDDRATFPSAGYMPPMGYNPQHMYGPATGPFPGFMPTQPNNYHLPQQYMAPMQQPSTQPPSSVPGHMPVVSSAAPIGAGANPMLYNSHLQQAGGQPSPQHQQQSQMIPVQFQNGRLNSPQQNGGQPVPPPQVSVNNNNNNNPQPNSQQHFTTPQQTSQTFSPQHPVSSQPQQTMAPHPMMQPPSTQQQQQQHIQHTLPHTSGPHATPAPSQLPGQYLPQQPFLMRQYPIPNGAGGYAPPAPPASSTTVSAAVAPSLDMMCNQQVAASGGLMSSVVMSQPQSHPHPQQPMALNQPVTQNFLVQNEVKANIPVYQQQR